MTFAYWCVLIAGLMPVLTVAIGKFGRRDYDNADPRTWMEKQDGWRRRADFAHRNHFEAFPFFAAAVIVAQLTGASPGVVTAYAAAFIVVRIAYTAFYLANRPLLRSVAWAIGFYCVIGIFVAALFKWP